MELRPEDICLQYLNIVYCINNTTRVHSSKLGFKSANAIGECYENWVN